jgi:hypothetical protein
VLCLGMHSNVMHRFMVQAFQDPPFCSSTQKRDSKLDSSRIAIFREKIYSTERTAILIHFDGIPSVSRKQKSLGIRSKPFRERQEAQNSAPRNGLFRISQNSAKGALFRRQNVNSSESIPRNSFGTEFRWQPLGRSGIKRRI